MSYKINFRKRDGDWGVMMVDAKSASDAMSSAKTKLIKQLGYVPDSLSAMEDDIPHIQKKPKKLIYIK